MEDTRGESLQSRILLHLETPQIWSHIPLARHRFAPITQLKHEPQIMDDRSSILHVASFSQNLVPSLKSFPSAARFFSAAASPSSPGQSALHSDIPHTLRHRLCVIAIQSLIIVEASLQLSIRLGALARGTGGRPTQTLSFFFRFSTPPSLCGARLV